MTDDKNQIFRKQALERVAFPDEINQLTTVVRPRHWLALAALGALAVVAVGWSVFGRVPETVEGYGLLINPGRVRPLEAPFAGQVFELKVRPGDEIARGDVIAVLEQPVLRKELQEARNKLAELRRFDAAQRELEQLRLSREDALTGEQKDLLDETAGEVTQLAEDLWTKNQEASSKQREEIAGLTGEAAELATTLRGQLDSLRSLTDRGLATRQQVSQTESSLFETQRLSSDLRSQRLEVDIQEQEARRFYVEQQNKAADLKLQIKKLDLELARLRQQVETDQAQRTLEIDLQTELVKLLEQQLAVEESVTSPAAGRVLEMTVQPGQVASQGMRIGSIETDEGGGDGERLRVLAYFPIGDGKRVDDGMEALVTPSTVQRERFGSIVGEVRRTVPFPTTLEAAAAAIGNEEVLTQLEGAGGVIEVEIEMERAETPSGFRWTSGGPEEQFSAGTSAQVRVVIEERAPISFLLPLLRELTFGKDR
jgi:HlyD family secretion protein